MSVQKDDESYKKLGQNTLFLKANHNIINIPNSNRG